MKVMLNTNVYGRPFDDLSQERIAKEANASYKIFLLEASDFITIVSSDVLLAEITLIEDKAKLDVVGRLIKSTAEENIKISKGIVELADRLFVIVNDYMDALHISSAYFGKCDYFITCDDELTTKRSRIEKVLKASKPKIHIRNPIEFIGEFGEFL